MAQDAKTDSPGEANQTQQTQSPQRHPSQAEQTQSSAPQSQVKEVIPKKLTQQQDESFVILSETAARRKQ